MGIEPTDRKGFSRPNGFEDRGHHQVNRHFQQCYDNHEIRHDIRKGTLVIFFPTICRRAKPIPGPFGF